MAADRRSGRRPGLAACRRAGGVTLLLIATALAAGCARQLMETPNLYADGGEDPFDKVPAQLRSSTVDVLYVTDRQRTNNRSARSPYGWGRSGALAFGSCQVQFGKDVGWDALVAASRTRRRAVELPIRINAVHEIGRTPNLPLRIKTVGDRVAADPKVEAEYRRSLGVLRQVLAERLAQTDHKAVYLHVHGYKEGFDVAVPVIAQIWHFLGRVGVPMAYTWPAGRGGLLRGYAYDRESSEFAVYHLRALLLALGSTEDVEKVHVIAHSRGTDIAMSAVREVLLLHGGDTEAARAALKLGILVLAAPDLDVDVGKQRLLADRFFEVPEQLVVYVSSRDEVIGVASTLFGSTSRIGELMPDDLPPEALDQIRIVSARCQIIDAEVTGHSRFGHDYYYRHPAVSSDLVLLLTGHLEPGTAHGRPLTPIESGFWRIDNDYPRGPAASEE